MHVHLQGFWAVELADETGGNKGYALKESGRQLDPVAGALYDFEYTPRILDIGPKFVPAGAGIEVTIRGAGFGGNKDLVTVHLGSTEAVVKQVSNGNIIAMLPGVTNLGSGVALLKFALGTQPGLDDVTVWQWANATDSRLLGGDLKDGTTYFVTVIATDFSGLSTQARASERGEGGEMGLFT